MEQRKGDTGFATRVGRRVGRSRVYSMMANAVELCAIALLSILVIVVVGAMFAVPVQAGYEGYYWLQHAEYLGFDWNQIVSPDLTQRMTSTEWLGWNVVADWVLGTWVSIPFSVVGVIAYTAIVEGT